MEVQRKKKRVTFGFFLFVFAGAFILSKRKRAESRINKSIAVEEERSEISQDPDKLTRQISVK